MKNYKLHTSEGVRDYLGLELLVKEEIEKRIKNLFISYGYELVKTPTFEYIDVYTSGSQTPSLYNLINRQGEVLALRSDMTSSIARIVASNNSKVEMPKKYAYIADTFRYPRLYQGKSHEFTQAGIEIIGTKNIKSDAECIKLAFEALKAINITNYTVHVGSSLFIEALFNDFGFDKNQIDNLLSIIQKKDFVLLKNTLDSYSLDLDKINLVIRLMENAGKLNFLQGIMSELQGTKSVKILQELKELYNELMRMGLENKLVFDFSIYSYANYYTGITFQVFCEGIGKASVTGGRCDNLLKTFGCDAPAIGFGLNINSVLDYIMSNDLIKIESVRYASIADKDSYVFAYESNNKLRANGVIVDVSMYDTLEETIEYAKANKCSKVLYYKNNSVQEIELEDK